MSHTTITPFDALIITSIAGPGGVLQQYARACRAHGTRFIVIGDTKSPADFRLDGCEFYSIEQQRALPLRLVRILPERHYARKNIGYLVAWQQGVGVLAETDDDNIPRANFWQPPTRHVQAAVAAGTGWTNVYRYFTDAHIWPRGFPLESIHAVVPPRATLPVRQIDCPIQQGLADENPDVDAVYRMTQPLPFLFNDAEPVAIGTGAWCPFNTQNTIWFRDAFPLLYLPSYCSFRMTDIWRSFVAQRICWANDWHVLFTKPTMRQERNEHNLLRNFADEVSGYLNNARIADALAALDIKTGMAHIPANLLACYRRLVELQLVGSEELALVDAWLHDCADVHVAHTA